MRKILLISLSLILTSCNWVYKPNDLKGGKNIYKIIGNDYCDCLNQYNETPDFSFEGVDLYVFFPEYKVGLDSLDNYTLWKLKCEKDFKTLNLINISNKNNIS